MGIAIPPGLWMKNMVKIPPSVSLAQRPVYILSNYVALRNKVEVRRITKYLFNLSRGNSMLSLQLFDELVLP
jgi:hypothetical protein